MSKSKLLALVALFAVMLHASSAFAQTWEAVDQKDAITDKSLREVCATQSQFRLCMTFEQSGVFVTVRSLGSDLFDSELFPALRVDQNKAFESVTPAVLDLERVTGSKLFPRSWQPTYVTWRAQVPSSSGQWTETPPKLVSQMIAGNSMLVRVYLTGGFQKDITFSLAGFCPAAAKVYAESAPPLACP